MFTQEDLSAGFNLVLLNINVMTCNSQ